MNEKLYSIECICLICNVKLPFCVISVRGVEFELRSILAKYLHNFNFSNPASLIFEHSVKSKFFVSSSINLTKKKRYL